MLNVTPTQRAAIDRRNAFNAKLDGLAEARTQPKVIQITQAEPASVPVPVGKPRVVWKSDEELAFGPIVHPKRTRPTLAAIIEATAKFYCLPEDEVHSQQGAI